MVKNGIYVVEKNTVVNTIYLIMLDYKHWYFLKENKPGNLAVKLSKHNVLQNKASNYTMIILIKCMAL